MRIGVLTETRPELTPERAPEHAQHVGAETIAFGAGSCSPRPHCDVPGLQALSTRGEELRAKAADVGLEFSAMNASGNHLYPSEDDADASASDAIRLAGELGVERVVLMSGLPAGTHGDAMSNGITTSWPPETNAMPECQWNDVVLPYWSAFSRFARAVGVAHLAVEMHADQLVYDVPSTLPPRDEIGDRRLYVDHNHLIRMGADPLVAIAEFGEAIVHVHAKDTRIEAAVDVRSGLESLTVDHAPERARNSVTVGRRRSTSCCLTSATRCSPTSTAGSSTERRRRRSSPFSQSGRSTARRSSRSCGACGRCASTVSSSMATADGGTLREHDAEGAREEEGRCWDRGLRPRGRAIRRDGILHRPRAS
ncbi:sugar phosphate isomerase/epimerase [Pseudoclavibacter chungangensis]|nr:sugar phosphate isomerase/epimerase [Pseudoclavibacter chungangensis]